LVQDSVFAIRKAWLRWDRRGAVEFQTAGNLKVVKDLKRGSNPAKKGGRPEDIFEVASKKDPGRRAAFIGFDEPLCPGLTILGCFPIIHHP
jgi:hypothetical protein